MKELIGQFSAKEIFGITCVLTVGIKIAEILSEQTSSFLVKFL